MQGFDNKALVLFPFYENYNSKGGQYKYYMRTGITKLCNYLQSIGIEPHTFYSDDVAREINDPRFVWVSSLSRADSFFASKYCEGMSEALTKPTVLYDEVYNEVTAKDPGSRDMTTEERFEMVLRHVNKAVAKIVPTYKIVIHICFKNKLQYKVTSKAGDNKIRIYVDANNLIPTTCIGGAEVNACDLLNVPYGNRALDLWEC